MKKKEKERLIYIISNGILIFNGSNYCCSYNHCDICKLNNTDAGNGSCQRVDHTVFTPEYTDEYINELKQSNPEWFI